MINDLLRYRIDSYPSRKIGYEDSRVKLLLDYINSKYVKLEEIPWEVEGIDVSVYQGVMNWDLADSRIDFAFIRARDGIYTGKTVPSQDAQFSRNWAETRRINKPRGAYIFFRPQQNALTQANLFLQDLGEDLGELPPVLDVEDHANMSKSALISQIFTFLNRFETVTNRKMMIYTSKSFWDYYVGTNTLIPVDRLVWAAHYNLYVTNPYTPIDWTSKNLTWSFWQYTSTGDGSYYGAQSRYIDKNRYNGNKEQFKTQFNLEKPPIKIYLPIIPVKRVEVTANALNMRALPNSTSTDIGTIKLGDDIPIVELANEWGRVEGWIHLGYTKDL